MRFVLVVHSALETERCSQIMITQFVDEVRNGPSIGMFKHHIVMPNHETLLFVNVAIKLDEFLSLPGLQL